MMIVFSLLVQKEKSGSTGCKWTGLKQLMGLNSSMDMRPFAIAESASAVPLSFSEHYWIFKATYKFLSLFTQTGKERYNIYRSSTCHYSPSSNYNTLADAVSHETLYCQHISSYPWCYLCLFYPSKRCQRISWRTIYTQLRLLNHTPCWSLLVCKINIAFLNLLLSQRCNSIRVLCCW